MRTMMLLMLLMTTAATADERTWGLLTLAEQPGGPKALILAGVSIDGALEVYKYAEFAKAEHAKNDAAMVAAICKEASEDNPAGLAELLDREDEKLDAARHELGEGLYARVSPEDAAVLRGLAEKIEVSVEKTQPGDAVRKGLRDPKWIIDTLCRGKPL